MFRNTYKISPFVDVLTHIIISVPSKLKVGIFVGSSLCKQGKVKEGTSVIPFYVPLFLMRKEKVWIKVKPKTDGVSIAMRGFVISNKDLKKALVKKRLWMPSACLTYEKGSCTFAAPKPMGLEIES
jgi:hypothetical protein